MKTQKISLQNIKIKSFIILMNNKEQKTIQGAALNVYITKVNGEKQGKLHG